MLSNRDLHDEIKGIELVKADNPVDTAKLKIGTLTLKLLHNIRTNQTTMMEKMGAERIKPKVADEEAEQKSE